MSEPNLISSEVIAKFTNKVLVEHRIYIDFKWWYKFIWNKFIPEGEMFLSVVIKQKIICMGEPQQYRFCWNGLFPSL